MRRPSKFRKSDVVRAIKAVVAAGIDPAQVEIEPDGKIVVRTPTSSPERHSELDKWIANNARGS
jgi:hypothetical protein